MKIKELMKKINVKKVTFMAAMVVTCGIAYCNKWIINNWLKL